MLKYRSTNLLTFQEQMSNVVPRGIVLTQFMNNLSKVKS